LLAAHKAPQIALSAQDNYIKRDTWFKEQRRAMEEKRCIIETMVFDQDSTLCDEELCYVCKDGVWQQIPSPDRVVRPRVIAHE
jgi:hypothetical protein